MSASLLPSRHWSRKKLKSSAEPPWLKILRGMSKKTESWFAVACGACEISSPGILELEYDEGGKWLVGKPCAIIFLFEFVSMLWQGWSSSDTFSASPPRNFFAVEASKCWKKSSNTRLLTSQYFCISFKPSKHIWARCSASFFGIPSNRCSWIVWMQSEEKRLVILWQ